jgi:predicted nucleic acid-binding protein
MTCFADSVYFLGLMHPADQYHARAVAAAATVQSLVTTQFVLAEVASSFARAADRWRFLSLLDVLTSDPRARIVATDNALFGAGVDLFRRRPDKDWSLIDCISFIVMKNEGISEALTADRHFEQAGFVVLLK